MDPPSQTTRMKPSRRENHSLPRTRTTTAKTRRDDAQQHNAHSPSTGPESPTKPIGPDIQDANNTAINYTKPSSPRPLPLPPATSEPAETNPTFLTRPNSHTTNNNSNNTNAPPSSSSSLPSSSSPPPASPAIAKLESQIASVRSQIQTTSALLATARSQLLPASSPSRSPAAAAAGGAEDDADADAAVVDAEAEAIVKRHIRLLHEYNEIKDIGQGLMGLIAEGRGVRVKVVMEEFGVGDD